MKKMLAMLMAAMMVLALAACGGTESGSSSQAVSGSEAASGSETASAGIPKEDLKIGFLYVGPVGDEGYSYAHDQGRKAMVEALGLDESQTLVVENVPETSDCEKTVRDLIDQGCNVIYATSFGHGEWVDIVAKDHPEVYFGHATGILTEDNLSTYMGRAYEARYLSGIVAGMNTKSGKIGYVAGVSIPEVVRGIDAFTLGVRSVNPEATVEVLWTNQWYAPADEKNAAQQLINKGCDVIAQHCDSTGPQIAAQEAGVLAIGYNASTLSAAPEAYLTAPLFHWDAYYTRDVQSIIDGTRPKGERFWGGLTTGMVSLDDLSGNCVEGTAEAVEEAKAKIESGELFVFTGPLKDNQGNEVVADGVKMTDDEMESMMWLVEGVIGNVAA